MLFSNEAFCATSRPCRFSCSFFLFLFFLFFCADHHHVPFVFVNGGNCVVKYRHGDGHALNLQKMVLPEGMKYYAMDDALECTSPNSCTDHIISGCAYVRCDSWKSCQHTQFIQTGFITCSGLESCLNIQVHEGQEMRCGNLMELDDSEEEDDGKNSQKGSESSKALSSDTRKHIFCEKSIVEVKDLMSCLGSWACVYPNLKNGVTIQVGGQGTVQCAFSSSSGGAAACANFVVEVNHASRACFASGTHSSSNHRKCAVYCDQPQDCKKSTIQFRVA